MKQNKFAWDVLGYAFFACVIAFVGILVGKLTIGFIISAILMLGSSQISSLSEDVIEVITSNFSFLVIWFVLVIYAKKKKQSSVDKLWFYGERKKGKSLIQGIAIGAIVSLLSFGVAMLFGGLRFSFSSFDIVVVGLVCLSGLVQSGAEEVLFRGFLMQGIMEKHSVRMGIFISSVVFAVTHVLNPGITIGAAINITMIGIVLSYLVAKWNCLSVAIGIHFIWNFIEEIVFGTPNSGIFFTCPIFVPQNVETSWFYNQRFGIEGAVQTFLLWCFVLLVLWNGEKLFQHFFLHRKV